MGLTILLSTCSVRRSRTEVLQIRNHHHLSDLVLESYIVLVIHYLVCLYTFVGFGSGPESFHRTSTLKSTRSFYLSCIGPTFHESSLSCSLVPTYWSSEEGILVNFRSGLRIVSRGLIF